MVKIVAFPSSAGLMNQVITGTLISEIIALIHVPTENLRNILKGDAID
jgi:hypothetical protein